MAGFYQMLLAISLALLLPTSAKLPLEDATATVDKIFTYHIDPEDFPGQDIQVKETGGQGLPSWLEFDKDTNKLTGIPTAKDRGVYILTAGEEMFAISVVQSTKNQVAQPAKSNEQIVCKPHDSITVVYTKINEDIKDLSNSQKMGLVYKAAAHLSLNPEHIFLTADGEELDSSEALVSGGGDSQLVEGKLSVLSWIAGCGAVKAQHMDILEKLETSAKDGTLGKTLGSAVSGWQVQSNQPKVLTKRRLKRQVLVTATMTPTSSTTERETTTTMVPTTTTAQPTQVVTTKTPTTSNTDTTTDNSETEATTQKKTNNLAPELNDNLVPPPIPAYGGELFRWTLPGGLFTDPEGGVLQYSVTSDSNKNRWLVTDKISGQYELITLADESLSGNTEVLRLTATDPLGASVDATIYVQHGSSRKDNVLETYTLRIKEVPLLTEPTAGAYLALTLSEQASFSNILITNIRRDAARSEIMVSFGDNRGPPPDTCPEDTNSESLAQIRELVGKEVQIKGSSDQLVVVEVKSVSQIAPCSNRIPEVNNIEMAKFKMLEVEVGKLYESVLPINLFTDYEDVNLSKIKVKLIVGSLEESQGWITLDSNTRTLKALTWDKPATESQYTLVAIDSDGAEVEEDITVKVIDNSYAALATNLFTLKIDEKYSVFANTQAKQISIYKKLQSVFTNANVHILSVKQGSVVVQYSLEEQNSKSPPDECPESVEMYKDMVFDGNNVQQSFQDMISPFKVVSVEFLSQGPCDGIVDPASAKAQAVQEPTATEEPKPQIAIIVGVVIGILVLIIIVVIIVVVCSRKQKEKTRKPGQNGSFNIETGVPKVLDEEKRSLGKAESQPLIMTPADVSYKPTPPAYPHNDQTADYQPDTPPVSEPDDEQRMIDRSL